MSFSGSDGRRLSFNPQVDTFLEFALEHVGEKVLLSWKEEKSARREILAARLLPASVVEEIGRFDEVAEAFSCALNEYPPMNPLSEVLCTSLKKARMRTADDEARAEAARTGTTVRLKGWKEAFAAELKKLLFWGGIKVNDMKALEAFDPDAAEVQLPLVFWAVDGFFVEAGGLMSLVAGANALAEGEDRIERHEALMALAEEGLVVEKADGTSIFDVVVEKREDRPSISLQAVKLRETLYWKDLVTTGALKRGEASPRPLSYNLAVEKKPRPGDAAWDPDFFWELELPAGLTKTARIFIQRAVEALNDHPNKRRFAARSHLFVPESFFPSGVLDSILYEVKDSGLIKRKRDALNSSYASLFLGCWPRLERSCAADPMDTVDRRFSRISRMASRGKEEKEPPAVIKSFGILIKPYWVRPRRMKPDTFNLSALERGMEGVAMTAVDAAWPEDSVMILGDDDEF